MSTVSSLASPARRTLALVAVASWLLVDSIRGAGPLLGSLADDSGALALAAAVAAFAAGGVLAWLCAIAGRHFGPGTVLLFMLAVVGVLRLGLPLLDGLWLINAGLYLLALAITTVVLAARMALGNGGPATTVAGTALGAAGAVAEQTLLRTWDAVWRGDLSGWLAMGVLAVLAVSVGWLCRGLEPVGASRGWWAYGLLWGLIVALVANVAWVNAQAEVRMSTGAALAMVSLVTAAALAAQAPRTSRLVVAILAAVGLAALGILLLRPGMTAAVALPVASAVAALSAAVVLRPADSSPMRRLGAATVFGLALVAAPLAAQLDAVMGLPGPAESGFIITGAALIAGGAWVAWQSKAPAGPDTVESAGPDGPQVGSGAHTSRGAQSREPWIAPGVLAGAVAGLLAGGGLAFWTAATFETERALSKDFLIAPSVMTWNLHAGVTPRVTGGPGVALHDIASTIESSAADVIMLQAVDRGRLIAGGTDMLEYLAGELRLPYAYGDAHQRQLGNAILTSRAHGDPRSIDLPTGPDGVRRSAVAVDFMGATFATARVAGGSELQADALAEWLDVAQPLVVGVSLGEQASDGTIAALAQAGFTDAQQELGVAGPTYLGSDPDGLETATRDHLLGRSVSFSSFETIGVGWSNHLPALARVTTGASAPTDVGDDVNEPQPEAGVSPSPSPSPTASARPSAGAAATPSPDEE
ncbi:hypothetical protein [Demequina sp. NBRC 110053]|uniref:endonuclease/exonuclease/phosphatase family protein n=1 Tax=Demequina sp. NBRC 110053 TaxID=1570342 RepID=UPI0009FCAAAB|nr:hypothetical protein [Demequina sp. NBRC 110053]